MDFWDFCYKLANDQPGIAIVALLCAVVAVNEICEAISKFARGK